MNWNIIIPITIFITDIILAWFCYKLGCHTVKPIEDQNQKILDENNILQHEQQQLKENINILKEEGHKLNDSIFNLKIEYKDYENKLIQTEQKSKLIEEKNEKAEHFIKQSEQLAREKAQAVYENELGEWNKRLEVVQKYQDQYLNKLEEDIHKVEDELQSLKDTKAAAIAAAQKEKQIQENKEDYCLILPIEERNDINILRGVVKKIAKPRSILMAIWQAYYAPIAKKKFPQILGKIDVCGIYKITNQETGECYIGQAVDVRRRWMDHCKMMLQIDAPKNNQLYKAAAEYGLDAFSFELLLECKPEELNEKEKYFIKLYNSDALGYNISKGG